MNDSKFSVIFYLVYTMFTWNVSLAQLPTEDPPEGPLHPLLAEVINKGPYKPQWQSLITHPMPDWFGEDKIGISAHWGPYAVPGWTPRKDTPYGVAYAEWYWQWMKQNQAVKEYHKKHYGDAGYDDFIDGTSNLITGEIEGFFAKDFDADRWMRLFKDAGAKYFFITSKHHDGFCIWDSAYTNRNARKMGPKRDLYGEMVQAARLHGLRVGFYYSYYEWNNPIYHGKSDFSDQDYKGIKKLKDEDDDGNDNEYVDDFMIPQIKELIDKYRPDYICFDGEWDHDYIYWRSRQIIAYYYNQAAVRGQEVIINDRFGNVPGGGRTRGIYGDFYHVEYTANIDRTKPWAMWRGFGNSYGYNKNEHPSNILSIPEVIRMVVDCVSDNGNIEFNLGPKADGTIAEFERQRLLAMGQWLKVNGEAIYGTQKSPFKELPFNGRCTLKILGNGNTRLYFHLYDWPKDRRIEFTDLQNKALQAQVLADQTDLTIRQNEGVIRIILPEIAPDEVVSVISLDIKGPPRVIRHPYPTQKPNRETVLKAVDGIIRGKTLRVEDGKNLGYWSDVSDTVFFPFLVKHTGQYLLEVEYACNLGCGGSLELRVADKKFVIEVEPTQSWTDYHWLTVGEVTLTRPGHDFVYLSPLSIKGQGLMNFRQIRLVPVD